MPKKKLTAYEERLDAMFTKVLRPRPTMQQLLQWGDDMIRRRPDPEAPGWESVEPELGEEETDD